MDIFRKVNLPPTYQFFLKLLLPKGILKVLDLGCGNGIAGELFNSGHKHEFTGVDIFDPYLKECKKRGYYTNVYKYDLTKIKLESKSYDVVLLLQVLEHLDKKQSIKLIRSSIKTSKKAVIISIPNGDCHQDEYDKNDYHIHKSAWSPQDLRDLGFQVYGQSFKPIFGTESYGSGKEAAFWQKIAVPLSVLISPIIFFIPELGAQLIAVKYIND